MGNIQLRYDIITAGNCGIRNHPEKQMKELGYVILHGVPQSIGDQWWFTVDKLREPLPEYLSVMEYDIEKWM